MSWEARLHTSAKLKRRVETNMNGDYQLAYGDWKEVEAACRQYIGRGYRPCGGVIHVPSPPGQEDIVFFAQAMYRPPDHLPVCTPPEDCSEG